jgi:cell division protein ZapE
MVKETDKLVRAVEAASADGFSLDPAQRATLDRLAVLGGELAGGALRRGSPRSLYIYGDAGRGKSWLPRGHRWSMRGASICLTSYMP